MNKFLSALLVSVLCVCVRVAAQEKIANLAVVYDDGAILARHNYSLGDNLVMGRVIRSLFSAQSTPILLNEKLAAAVLYVLAAKDASTSAKKDESVVAACAAANTPAAAALKNKVDKAWSDVESSLLSVLPKIKAIRELATVANDIEKQPACPALLMKDLGGIGYTDLFGLTGVVSLNDWQIYILPSRHFVLFIPNQYIQKMSRAGLAVADAIGLNIDNNAFVKVTSANMSDQITKLPSRPSEAGGIVSSFKTLFKQPNPAHPITWDVFFHGHGWYRSDVSSAAVTGVLKERGLGSLMVGMPTDEFMRVLDYLATLLTNIVIWDTCYGGGYHAEGVSQLGTIARWPFMAISVATGDMPSISMEGLSHKALFSGIEKIFERVNQAAKNRDDKTALLKQALPEFVQVIKNLTKEKSTYWLPGQKHFQPLIAQADTFDITPDNAEAKTPLVVPAQVTNVFFYTDSVTAPLTFGQKNVPYAIEVQTGGQAAVEIETVTSQMPLDLFFASFFKENLGIVAGDIRRGGTNQYHRTFSIDSLTGPAGGVGPFVSTSLASTIHLNNVLVVQLPNFCVAAGFVVFAFDRPIFSTDKTGRQVPAGSTTTVYKLSRVVSKFELVESIPLKDARAVVSAVAAAKNQIFADEELIAFVNAGDTVRALAAVAGADAVGLGMALVQAAAKNNQKLVKNLAPLCTDFYIQRAIAIAKAFKATAVAPLLNAALAQKKQPARVDAVPSTVAEFLKLLRTKGADSQKRIDAAIAGVSPEIINDAFDVVVHQQEMRLVRLLLPRVQDAAVIDRNLQKAVADVQPSLVRALAPRASKAIVTQLLQTVLNGARWATRESFELRDALAPYASVYGMVANPNAFEKEIFIKELFQYLAKNDVDSALSQAIGDTIRAIVKPGDKKAEQNRQDYLTDLIEYAVEHGYAHSLERAAQGTSNLAMKKLLSDNAALIKAKLAPEATQPKPAGQEQKPVLAQQLPPPMQKQTTVPVTAGQQ